MEIQLLKIGIGLFLYAFFVRLLFKRKTGLQSRPWVAGLHILFTGAIGALVGFVVSASVDLHGPTMRWPVGLALAGIAWGVFQCVRAKNQEESVALLAGDFDLAETSYSAVILAAVIMYAVIQAFKIPSGSMRDTLEIGDHLFVNKFMYGVRVPLSERRLLKWRDVKRGDVVVFECPPSALSLEERERKVHKDFIKRAIALPGDEVAIRNKHLYINGQLQNEPYAVYRDPVVIPQTHREGTLSEFQQSWSSGDLSSGGSVRDNFGPVKIPQGHYFVMGDNRDESFDARFWGPLPNRLLKGKAWFVYWPPRRIKVIR